MIHQIYIFCLIVITIIVVTYYYIMDAEYKKELDKINRLESKYIQDQNALQFIRSQSRPCPVGDFKSPRSCYFDSGNTCTWNDAGKRCDAKN